MTFGQACFGWSARLLNQTKVVKVWQEKRMMAEDD